MQAEPSTLAVAHGAEAAPAAAPLSTLGRAGRFGLVGVAGFACDAGVLTLLVQGLGWNPYLARLISFSFAVTCTWALNRRFAFGDRQSEAGRGGQQYLQYVGAQTVGSAANVAVYAFAVWQWPALQAVVVVPLAIGAVAGVLLNYLLLDRWVFKRRPRRD